MSQEMGALEIDYHVRFARVLDLARYVVPINMGCTRVLSVRPLLLYAKFAGPRHIRLERAIRGIFQRSLPLRYVLHRG